MKIRPIWSYTAGVAALVLVLVGAALLPLAFVGEEAPYDSPATWAPIPNSEMPRNAKVEMVRLHMDYAARASVSSGEPTLPEGLEILRIGRDSLSGEQREWLDARFERLMEGFVLEDEPRLVRGRGDPEDDEIWDEETNFFRRKLELGYTVKERGGGYYSFTNTQGETARVWHVYGRFARSWETWVNTYIDIDTGEVYFFYVSSVFVGGERGSAESKFLSMGTQEVAELWTRLNGLQMEGLETSEGSSAATIACVAGNDIINYNMHLVNLDLRFTMLSSG